MSTAILGYTCRPDHHLVCLYSFVRRLTRRLWVKWDCLSSKPAAECVRLYLKLVRRWPFCGAKLFPCSVSKLGMRDTDISSGQTLRKLPRQFCWLRAGQTVVSWSDWSAAMAGSTGRLCCSAEQRKLGEWQSTQHRSPWYQSLWRLLCFDSCIPLHCAPWTLF